MTGHDCTCAKGVLCEEAHRLDNKCKAQHEQFLRTGQAIHRAAWQLAEREYQAHMAAAYTQKEMKP